MAKYSRRKVRKKPKASTAARIINLLGFAFVGLVVVGVILYIFDPDAQQRRQNAQARTQTTTQQGTQTSATQPARPQRQGQPWEFDAGTNMHWDPRSGHLHWHPGPPPDATQRASLLAQDP